MVFPAVNLHTFHSLNFYDGLDIIFDLKLLVDTLQKKDVCAIHLIPDIFTIHTNDKLITIKGYRLNDSTIMVNNNGDIINIPYSCSNDTIHTGIEYVYQMYKNMNMKYENINTKWNPKPYRPE